MMFEPIFVVGVAALLWRRSFAPLPSYTVFDLAVSTRAGAATWSAGSGNAPTRSQPDKANTPGCIALYITNSK